MLGTHAFGIVGVCICMEPSLSRSLEMGYLVYFWDMSVPRWGNGVLGERLFVVGFAESFRASIVEGRSGSRVHSLVVNAIAGCLVSPGPPFMFA